MNLKKILFGLLATATALVVLNGIFYYTDVTIFLAVTAAFSTLVYFRPHWAFYLVILLPALGEFSRFTLLGKSLIASDVIIPLFIIIWLIKNPKLPVTADSKKIFTTIGIFILVAFISLFFSLTALPYKEVLGGGLYLIRLISYLLLLPISISLFSSDEQKSQLLKVILFSAFLIATTGFIQLELMPDLEELAKTQGYDPHINRLVGSWLDPNFIGGFFAFIIALFSGIFLYYKNTKQIIFTIIILLILGTALFLTYSRSAYLALAASIFLIGLFKSRRLLFTIIILSLIGISVSDRAQQRVGELITSVTSVITNSSENPDPTARLRIQNWDQTIQLIENKPILGHGYNNLTAIKLQEGYLKDADIHSASGSDSSFLTIAATTGITGLLIFAFTFILIIWKSSKKWLHGTSDLQKGLGLGILAATLGLLVHSNFVNSLLFPQIMIFFWPLVGLLFSEKTNN